MTSEQQPEPQQYTILIVEDDPATLRTIVDTLKEYGYKILIATTGEIALERAKYARPDLILLDILLPGIDGFETCRWLKANQSTQDIPVIFMTVLTNIEDKIRGFELGGVDYLTKPIHRAEIIARVNTHLRIWDLTRNLQEQNHRLQKLLVQQDTISQVGKQVTSILDLEHVLATIVRSIQVQFSYAVVGIWLLDEQLQAVVLQAGAADDEQDLPPLGFQISIDTSQNVIVQACKIGQEYIVDDRYAEQHQSAQTTTAVARSELVLPLQVGPETIGVLDIQSDLADAFQHEERTAVQTLARQIAIAIRNAQLYKREKMLRRSEEERAHELAQLNARLEQRVEERTAELQNANTILQQHINERERAESELAEERNLLRTLIDALPDYIYVKDTAGRFVVANVGITRGLGFVTTDELVSKAGFELYPQEMAAQYAAQEQDVINSGQPLINHEEAIIDAAGQRRWLLTTKVPVRDSQGKVVRIVGVDRDITEHRRLEEQLHAAQKMEAIGRLAGGIAHDFNNVLTSIIGYTKLILDSLPSNASIRSDLEGIEASANRGANLTHQLLAFTRKQVIEPHILNPNELIVGIEQMLQRLINEDIRLLTNLAPDTGYVKIDPGQLEQVLVNLVVNARDAMSEGGTLTIETANVTLDQEYARQRAEVVPGDYIMIAVSDNGSGMDDTIKARIFEPFFTTKGVGKGTGLGLATCFGIVKQNGGHISVYSEPGQGSTFKIYLPRIYDHTHDPRNNHGHTSSSRHGNETILLVEDDSMILNLLARVLRRQGYTILVAANGAEALGLVQRERDTTIQLLITDWVMPHLGGEALADQLQRQYPNLKVLFISGYTDNALINGGILESGSAFLQKPFAPDALIRKVREVLDSG